MVSLALVRAEDAPKRCRIEAATFNQDERPSATRVPGSSAGAAAERREVHLAIQSREFVLVDGDADAVGSVIISESAHPPVAPCAGP